MGHALLRGSVCDALKMLDLLIAIFGESRKVVEPEHPPGRDEDVGFPRSLVREQQRPGFTHREVLQIHALMEKGLSFYEACGKLWPEAPVGVFTQKLSHTVEDLKASGLVQVNGSKLETTFGDSSELGSNGTGPGSRNGAAAPSQAESREPGVGYS
jgi:hypothetical protein